MGSIDRPLDELVGYKPDQTKRSDFDAFWDGLCAESATLSLHASFTRVEDILPLANVFDVGFDGVDGVRVKGWFLTPKEVHKPLPTVVQFIGYSGGREYPHALASHVLNGFCAFIMDSRGQGGGKRGSVWKRHTGANAGLLPTAYWIRMNIISRISIWIQSVPWRWFALVKKWTRAALQRLGGVKVGH